MAAVVVHEADDKSVAAKRACLGAAPEIGVDDLERLRRACARSAEVRERGVAGGTAVAELGVAERVVEAARDSELGCPAQDLVREVGGLAMREVLALLDGEVRDGVGICWVLDCGERVSEEHERGHDGARARRRRCTARLRSARLLTGRGRSGALSRRGGMRARVGVDPGGRRRSGGDHESLGSGAGERQCTQSSVAFEGEAFA